jgi:hypothetical protein
LCHDFLHLSFRGKQSIHGKKKKNDFFFLPLPTPEGPQTPPTRSFLVAC